MPSVFKYNGNEIIDSNGKVTATAMNSSGDAPVYACRAWVNFDGTKDASGQPSTANTNRLIRASGNVASVLRRGTGQYTVNFTTPMPDANYSTIATPQKQTTASDDGYVMGGLGTGGQNDSSVQVTFQQGSAGPDDMEQVSVAIFR